MTDGQKCEICNNSYADGKTYTGKYICIDCLYSEKHNQDIYLQDQEIPDFEETKNAKKPEKKDIWKDKFKEKDNKEDQIQKEIEETEKNIAKNNKIIKEYEDKQTKKSISFEDFI